LHLWRSEGGTYPTLQANLEKQIKELNLRIIDLETRSYASPSRLSLSGTPRKVDSKIEELSAQLQGREKQDIASACSPIFKEMVQSI
jgi:myosin protein heavy chain